jgi:protein-disulfide isomerase
MGFYRLGSPSALHRVAAAAQGAFWPMHDLLLEHQDALQPADLVRYAQQLGLDGAYDIATLSSAVRAAGARATLASANHPNGVMAAHPVGRDATDDDRA